MTAFTFMPGDTTQWMAVLIDAAAKGLVVLLLAGGATLLLRRSSAAVRHMTWTLSIAALILVPFLSLALPQLQVPLLPDWAGTGGLVLVQQPSPSPLAVPAQSPAVGESGVGTGGPGAESVMPTGDWPSPAGVPQPVHPADASPETPAAPAPAAAAPQTPPVHWSAWVLLAWLAGAAALLLPLLAGTIIVWRQARRAERINSGSWVHLLDELRPQLGVRGRVVLLRSNWPNIPLTCGVFRPAIILPAEADDWPADRRRVVLLHELAHIRRRDCLTQLLARLARVIYWFNPLVWLAGRMLRIEREQACDDLVLASGHKASDYAGHLLEIVRSLHSVRCPSPAAVAMARKSQFEGRLLAILDPRRNRRAMTRLGILIAAILVAAIAVPLAVLKATGPDNADVAALIEQLKGQDEYAWKSAVKQLVKTGPTVAEPVSRVFAQCGPGDARALQVLEAMAKDPDVQALMRKGLNSDNTNVVHCSLIVLGKSDNRDHVAAIVPLLDKSAVAACIALSELGGDEAFHALLATLNKPNIKHRWMIAELLAGFGKSEAIPEIEKALSNLTGEDVKTAPRFVRAIHKLEGSQPPCLHSFSSFHAVGDCGWSLLEGMNLGKMHSVYIQPFHPKNTVEQTRIAAYQALTAKDGLDLAWDQSQGNRLLAVNGLRLAPYTPALPKGYDVWDGEKFLDQRQLASIVETYNATANVPEIEARVRAYPFKSGDYFLALLPDGRVGILRPGEVTTQAEHVYVPISLKVFDPLYKEVPASAFATGVITPSTQPAGVRFQFEPVDQAQHQWRLRGSQAGGRYVLHGYCEVTDGEVIAHSGGGSKSEDTNQWEFAWRRDGNMLVMNRTPGGTLSPVWPEGAELRVTAKNDSVTLYPDRYTKLWQGDFVKGGRVLKSVYYLARLADDAGMDTGFLTQQDPAGNSWLADASSRKFPAFVVFINNKRYGPSNGSSLVPPKDGVTEETGKSTCGHPGAVSEIEWKYLRTTDAGDEYEVTRRFPVDTATPNTEKKTVTYSGKPLTVFEDEVQRVLFLSPEDFKSIQEGKATAPV